MDDREVEKLVDALDDPRRQQHAASELRMLGAAASPALARGLRDGTSRVRRWCALLLDEAATTEAIPAILDALNDESADVRRVALHAIGCQHCKESCLPVDVVGLLVERLQADPSIRVRRAAAQLLGTQPFDAGIIGALREVLREESDNKLRSSADWSLSRQARLLCETPRHDRDH